MCPTAGEPRRSVVITGVGVISCFGRGADPLWRGLCAPDAGRAAGASRFVVAGYAGPPNLDKQAAALLGRCSTFAADAAIQAVEDARLPFTARSTPLIGVSFGSEHGERELPVAGAPASSLARVLGIAGPVLPCGGPGAGLLAVAEGYEMVRRGAAPVVVSGGADAGPLAERDLRAAQTRFAGRLPRPFDAGRDGDVESEGAAALVLEDGDLARDRGARVYCELLGAGSVFSRAPVVLPAMNHVDAARAMQAALMRAEVFQGEVETVFAAARGLGDGDHVEARALAEVWGPNVDRLTITSVHGALGYAAGAAGPLALAAALRSLREGLVPATAGCSLPDPAFRALDIVIGEARTYRFNTALVNDLTAAANVAVIVRSAT